MTGKKFNRIAISFCCTWCTLVPNNSEWHSRNGAKEEIKNRPGNFFNNFTLHTQACSNKINLRNAFGHVVRSIPLYNNTTFIYYWLWVQTKPLQHFSNCVIDFMYCSTMYIWTTYIIVIIKSTDLPRGHSTIRCFGPMNQNVLNGAKLKRNDWNRSYIEK